MGIRANHVFVIRDISRTTEQTGERDPLIVEPCTRSDVCLRHVSCGARAAPSLTRIINNVRKSRTNLHIMAPKIDAPIRLGRGFLAIYLPALGLVLWFLHPWSGEDRYEATLGVILFPFLSSLA